MDATTPPVDQTLLIVDDDPQLTDLFNQVMTRRGYHVLTAVSGQQALETVAAEPGSVSLVLTDMTMPDMTGMELARRLYESYPHLPVMILTGHDLDPAALDMTPNVIDIVRKPYKNNVLAERIQELLARD